MEMETATGRARAVDSRAALLFEGPGNGPFFILTLHCSTGPGTPRSTSIRHARAETPFFAGYFHSTL
jgi:hypothetical protein